MHLNIFNLSIYFKMNVMNVMIEKIMKLFDKIYKKGNNIKKSFEALDLYNIFRKLEKFTRVPILKKLVYEIVKFIGKDKAVEIGVGTGLWIKVLRKYGIDIIGIDRYDTYYRKLKEEEVFKYNNLKYILDKNYSTPYYVKNYHDGIKLLENRNVIIFMWTEIHHVKKNNKIEPYDYVYLKNFKGDKFIFVGEFPYSVDNDMIDLKYDPKDNDVSLTGSMKFFREMRKNWKIKKVIPFRFAGTHDKLYFFTRK